MFASLNSEQQQAVQTTEGPVQILAGAGTGKTHTLIERIAYLVREKQVPPSSILMLTHTNKAAHELNERLSSGGLGQVHATTFHSLAAGFLRESLRRDFIILSAAEQEELLRDLLYYHDRDELAEVVMDFNNVRQAAACGAEWPPLLSSVKLDRFGELFQMFRNILDEKNAFDFCSLLTSLLELWKSEPLILEECRDQISYVLVDDIHNATSIQIELARQLTARHNNLCVAGDPNQSTDAWLDLYPDATSITFTKNYRNSSSILAGATALISHNPTPRPLLIEPTLPGESPIHLWESRDEWQMNEMVFHLLDQFFGAPNSGDAPSRPYSDVALITRTQTESRFLAAHLAQRGLPFQVSTLQQFWEHKEVRRFLEKLTAIRGIGLFTTSPSIATFSEWFRVKLEEFVWHQSIPEKKALIMMQLLPHAMSFDHFDIPEALSRFLDAADTAVEADNLVLDDHLTLMTLQAAKGMEFPIVMIFGLEEGILPHKRTKNDPHWVAEERQLLYMGMTRAKEQLHLFRTCAVDGQPRDASRFIAEIGADHLTYGHLPDKRSVPTPKAQPKKAQLVMF